MEGGMGERGRKRGRGEEKGCGRKDDIKEAVEKANAIRFTKVNFCSNPKLYDLNIFRI